MGIDSEGAARSRAKVDAVWDHLNALLSDGRKYLARTDRPSVGTFVR
jgi:glutathione S-transferase